MARRRVPACTSLRSYELSNTSLRPSESIRLLADIPVSIDCIAPVDVSIRCSVPSRLSATSWVGAAIAATRGLSATVELTHSGGGAGSRLATEVVGRSRLRVCTLTTGGDGSVVELANVTVAADSSSGCGVVAASGQLRADHRRREQADESDHHGGAPMTMPRCRRVGRDRRRVGLAGRPERDDRRVTIEPIHRWRLVRFDRCPGPRGRERCRVDDRQIVRPGRVAAPERQRFHVVSHTTLDHTPAHPRAPTHLTGERTAHRPVRSLIASMADFSHG